jgi:hypothetical protein
VHEKFVLDRVAVEQVFIVVPRSSTLSIIAPFLYIQLEYYISQWVRPLNLETQQCSSQHCVYCAWSVNNTVSTQSPYRLLYTIQLSVSTESVQVIVRCLEMSRFWVYVNPPATGPLLLCLSTRTWPWISECSCLLLTLNTWNRETGAATFTLRSLYPKQIISTADSHLRVCWVYPHGVRAWRWRGISGI